MKRIRSILGMYWCRTLHSRWHEAPRHTLYRNGVELIVTRCGKCEAIWRERIAVSEYSIERVA